MHKTGHIRVWGVPFARRWEYKRTGVMFGTGHEKTAKSTLFQKCLIFEYSILAAYRSRSLFYKHKFLFLLFMRKATNDFSEKSEIADRKLL